MQTIGERLEEARKKKGISIREAAEATKIRGDYLQKFESNHFDIGLTEIYTRGFLRTYATFLKLPGDRILNDYAALGRGDIRPRQPSREIYGRMDISVSTAGEASDRAAPPEESASAEPANGAPRAQPRYPRSGGANLPTGPDPAMIFKYVKIGAIVVGALLVVLILKALFTGNSPSAAPAASRTGLTPTAETSAVTASPRPNSGSQSSYRLIATDYVQVRVNKVIGLDGDGDEVYNGVLTKGQSVTIPWNESHNVHASEGQNLRVEVNGAVSQPPFTGVGFGQMLKKAPGR
jgi:cytoskeleton protein RodZ